MRDRLRRAAAAARSLWQPPAPLPTRLSLSNLAIYFLAPYSIYNMYTKSYIYRRVWSLGCWGLTGENGKGFFIIIFMAVFVLEIPSLIFIYIFFSLPYSFISFGESFSHFA